VSHLLRAEFRGKSWHITCRTRVVPDARDDALRQRARVVGRQWLKTEFSKARGEADPWLLEQLKACLGEGEAAVGLGELLADACVRDRGGHQHATVAAPRASVRALARALEARDQPVAGARRRRMADRLGASAATLIAAAMWLWTLVRTIHEASGIPAEPDAVLAVHGEWSNRTRHVLSFIEPSAEPTPVVVLGRPRRSLAALGRLFDEKVSTAPRRLARPYSLGSALLSSHAAGRMVLRALRAQSSARYAPPLMQQAAMIYRLILGAASARWWEHSGVRTPVVVYGHTGLADTTLLELAQQTAGSQTIHVVHGLSAGPNFAGYSDHALLRCSFDAEYYRELGGYGACHAPSLAPVAFRGGAGGCLLLSNLAHPMNPGYREAGVRDELRLLKEAARAANSLWAPEEERAWKPHPVFLSLPAAERRTLMDAARAEGFVVYGQDWKLEGARNFAVVLCTASTIAVDMLRLGVLPIIFDVQPIEPDSAIAQLPLRADDSAALRQLIEDLRRDTSVHERYFALAWDRVGPARSYDMRLIVEVSGLRSTAALRGAARTE
jgi:hypothetical protein